MQKYIFVHDHFWETVSNEFVLIQKNMEPYFSLNRFSLLPFSALFFEHFFCTFNKASHLGYRAKQEPPAGHSQLKVPSATVLSKGA